MLFTARVCVRVCVCPDTWQNKSTITLLDGDVITGISSRQLHTSIHRHGGRVDDAERILAL